MKVGNSVIQNTNLTKTIEEQLNKLPDSIAPAPDLKPMQTAQDQAAKSESAKLSSAAQESLIRSELEQKYTNPKNTSESNESTGEQTLNESQRKQAEEALGDPLERLKQGENNTQDASSQKENPNQDVANKMKDFGSVYGDGIPNSSGSEGGNDSLSTNGGGSKGSSESSIGSGSSMTPEQRAKFEEMAGYNQGPASATSKIDDLNSKVPQTGFDKRDAAVKGIIDAANPFARMQDPTSSSNSGPGSSDRAGKYGGTGMISGAGSQANAAQGFVAVTGAAASLTQTPVGKVYGTAVGLGIAFDKFYEAKTGESLGVTLAKSGEDEKIAQQMEEQKEASEKAIKGAQSPGMATATNNGAVNLGKPTGAPKQSDADLKAFLKKKAEEQAAAEARKKAEEEEAARKKAEEEKKKNSGKDYDQETYNRGLGQKLGLDLNLPKAPKTSGDVDPDENATEIGTELSPFKQKSTDMISQPAERVREGGGPSGNMQVGGDVDFEDKAGWAGREITEEPGDVNLPGQQEELPPAANSQDEESDEESKSALQAQLALNLQRASQIRMRG